MADAAEPIDALDAAVIGISQLYADVLELEIAGDRVIQLGRAAAPAPLHLVIDHP